MVGGFKKMVKKKKVTESNKLTRKLAEIQVFRQTFSELYESEKSDFGKLLLQENLIFREIVGLMSLVNFYQKVFDFKKEQRNLFNNCTLGGLNHKLQEKIFDSEIHLKREEINPVICELFYFLSTYTKKRNKLTHRVFSGEYKEMVEVFVDSKIVIEMGKIILKRIKQTGKILEKEIFSN